MIVCAASPREGDLVQGGERGEHIGKFSRYNAPGDNLLGIELPDGRTVYARSSSVWLLTDRLVDAGDWQGPIERAGERLTPGRYAASSEDWDGRHHEGTLDVSERTLKASWVCSRGCACQPFHENDLHPLA